MGIGGDESTTITAGLPGFLVVFFLAMACWLLFRDMSRRLRTVRKMADQEDAESGAADQADINSAEINSAEVNAAETDSAETASAETGSAKDAPVEGDNGEASADEAQRPGLG